MNMKKRKLRIIIPAIIILLVVTGIGLCFYFTSPVSGSNAIVEFTVKENTSTTEIINDLKKKKLIKNVLFTKVYIKINNINSIKAGNFELKRSMSLKEIFKTITNSSNIKEDTVLVTFLEGYTIKDYAKEVNKNFNISEDEFINQLNNKEYLKELINKYWFLTDEILNEQIYYPLEGYLAPDSYLFNKDAKITDIVEKMLDQEKEILDEYKNKIESSGKSVHYILTLASVAELEGTEDRKDIVGVFYNRINNGDKLGSDVTTYYGAGIKMSDRDLYESELNAANGYNTRSDSMAGKIPVGPICNPSKDAISSTINYNKNDYYFFVSDKNGNIYFNKTYDGHINTINDLVKKGLWFEY